MFRSQLSLAAGLLLAAAAAAAKPKAAAAGVAYSDPEGRFTCDVPSGWDKRSDEGGQTKNVIFQHVGPKSKESSEKASWDLSVFYYAPDNEQFRTPDEYISYNHLPPPGGRASAVKPVDVKAGPAKRWTVTRPMPSGPEDVEEGDLKETFVVVAAKKGFFVLSYSSDADAYDRHAADFKRLVDSFTPGKTD